MAGDTVPALLNSLDQQQLLPAVTVVLDVTEKDKVMAHVQVNGQYDEVHDDIDQVFRAARPGPRNAFSAGFIHELGEGTSNGTMLQMVKQSAIQGIEKWKDGL
jgi:hypothetical protein